MVVKIVFLLFHNLVPLPPPPGGVSMKSVVYGHIAPQILQRKDLAFKYF